MKRQANGVARRFGFGVVLGVALASSGCATGVEDPSTPPASLPMLSAALVSEPLVHGAVVTAQAGVVYVSLPPEAYPGGLQATIRNPANGRQEVVQMVSGGWDPVAIAAEAGDTLRILITTARGQTIEYMHPVPPTRPPVIVRTDPPRRKRDVPLNAMLLVVFSEPIDPSTVTPQRVHLLRDGQPVEAAIEVSSDGLRMTIRPEGELVPGTEYVLVVSAELTDLAGERLEQGAEVEFSTVIEVENRSLAFVRGEAIFASALDGSEPVALVSDGARPVWSPDGTRLAFTRPTGNSLARWQLCIGQADGSDIRCATGEADGDVAGGPSWSPDGATVAFSASLHGCSAGPNPVCSPYFTRLSLLNTSTMQVETLPTPQVWSASWSPDGRKIAIALFGIGTYGRGALAIVNPDGSGLEILAQSFGSYSVSDVEWSPDGSKLALTLLDEHACPWYCDTLIGVINADGTELRVLDKALDADQVYFWTPPEWSPDGIYLAYTVSRGGSCYLHDLLCNDIAVVDVNSGRVGILLSNGAYPSWRP